MPDQTESSFWSSIKKNISKQRQQAPIKPVKDKDIAIPLSYNQEQLWQLDQLNPNSVHNIANALKFELKLDFSALEKSLREIVRRHFILRTVFPVVDGKPVQKVISENNFQLSIVNLAAVALSQQEARSKEIAVAEKQQAFNLIKEPGFRAKLIQLAETKYILLFTVHHIIFDGVSFGIFFKELRILYEAFSQNKPHSLPKLSIQYADFAYWQRQILADSTNNHLLSYWQQRFATTVESLKLPQDSFLNTAFNYEGKSLDFKLSPALTRKVKSFSSEQKITLFTTLLTTFKILLYCYTQQTDIMLVSPTAGRDRPEIKGLIGYFNNMLVLRSKLNHDSTFLATLNLVARTISEAKEHQDFPFKQITDLPILGSISLSRAMFSLSNYNTEAPRLSTITPTFFDIRDADVEKSNFDFSLSMYDRGSQLTGTIKYKTALFLENTIKQVAANFQSLLENLLDNPQLSLNALPAKNYKRRSQFSIVSQQEQLKLLDHSSVFGNIDHNYKKVVEDINVFLTQHASIKKAMVVARSNCQNRFLIYILPLPTARLDKQELKAQLEQRYPQHAELFSILILQRIPLNQEHRLDLQGMSSLPLTPKGNVFLPAIPVASWQTLAVEKSLFQPQNIIQEMIAQVWAEVLGLETYVRGASKFNIHDNFFELGGHSLAAVKLIDRLEQNFQVELSIRDLFESPTISSLAAKINYLKEQYHHNSEAQAWSHIVPIKTGGSKQPFFLIPGGGGGERTLMIYGQLLFLLGKEQPIYGLRTHSTDGGGWTEEIHDSVEKLAAAYVTEICQLQTQGTYLIAGECIGGIVAFEVAQQLLKKGCQVSLLLIDTLCPKGIKNLYSAKIDLFSPDKVDVRESLSLLTRKAREYYLEIIGKYQPDIYPDKITMLISEDRVSKELALNWQHLAQNGCDVYEVPGDHDSYLGKMVETTAQQLKHCLTSLQDQDTNFIITGSSLSKSLTSAKNAGSREQSQLDLTISKDNYTNVWHCLNHSEKRAAIYEHALANHPDPAFVYTVMGRIKARAKEFEQAQLYYQKAIAQDPYNFGAYLCLGDNFCAQKEFEQAMKAFEQARKLDSSNPMLYISLGKYYSEIGDSQQAISVHRQALSLAPDNLAIYGSLGSLQTDLGLIEAAFTTFNSALEIEPDNTHINLCIAHLHRQNSNYEAAVISFKKALVSQPNNINTYIHLGASLSKMGKTAEAKKLFFDAIDREPNSPTLYHNLGDTQRQAQEYETAVLSYRHSLELNPQQISVYKTLAHTLNHLKQSTAAIAVLEQAIALESQDPALYKLLGNIQRQAQEYEAAVVSYRHSLELEPQVAVYKSLSHALNHLKQLTAAIAVLEQAIALEPQDPTLYKFLGNIQRQTQEYEAAINSYYHSLELDPNQFNTHNTLAASLHQVGRSAEAIKVCQAAIELDPNHAGIYITLGNAQLKSADLNSAIASYQKAIELNPQQPFVVYKNLGNFLSRAAIIAYQKALELQPNNQQVQSALEKLTGRD